MFLPARMTRVLLGGHQDRMEDAIEALHDAGVVHLEDYQDDGGHTRIGTPLEQGDRLSELLVRTRGMQKSLGADGMEPRALPTNDPAGLLEEATDATQPLLDELADVRSQAALQGAEIAALEPYAGLAFDLSVLGTLSTVQGYVGTARDAPELSVSHEIDSRAHGSGVALALFVRTRDAPAAEQALQAVGFSPAVLPTGRAGTPQQRLEELHARKREVDAHLRVAEAKLAAARETWGPRLAALERHLAGEVAKTQAPLRFGVTERTFHVEGWVPRRNVRDLRARLTEAFGSSIYFEELGDAPAAHAHGSHGAHAAHGSHEAAAKAAHDADVHHNEGEAQVTVIGHDDHHLDPRDEPPVHLENPRAAKPYQYLLGLLGRPRYGEIDPSKIMLLFFPLFFGLMVGDVVIGALIMAAGVFLKTHKVFGIGGPAIGKALFAGGLVSVLVGAFIFGEALGMHFVLDEEALEAGEYSWEAMVFGLDADGHLKKEIASEGWLHKTGGHDDVTIVHSVTDEAMSVHAGEVEHAEPAMFSAASFKPHSDVHLKAGPVPLGIYSKTHDAQALLQWAAVIGFVHIVMGLTIGVRNVAKNHGVVLAVQEKVSWLTLIVGVAVAVWGLSLSATPVLAAGIGIAVASIILLWQGVGKVLGVTGVMGFVVAVLEVAALGGNILSYTRLAAIGASKAGMAIAFASIAFEKVGGGDVHSVAGWAIYIVASMLILVLAIIAGTLQSLRLQFVEFFGKFFEGGGRPFAPFGRRSP